MKRHIIGLVIFSSVVGMAILVKSFLFVKPEVDYSEVTKNSCWRMKKDSHRVAAPQSFVSNQSIIEQATLDVKTRKMNWRIKVPQNNSRIALHFFVTDEKGTNYLATEFAPTDFMDKSSSATRELEFTSSYLWLDKLSAPENLYVIPEQISPSDLRAKNFNVKFDETKAVSVLLYASGTVTFNSLKR